MALKDVGKSTRENFCIKLENCSFGSPTANNKVTVTFIGKDSSVNNDLLGSTGNTKGVSVAITDCSGAVIELGKPIKEHVLLVNNNTLNFAAYMQGDGASPPL